ncbi:MAG: hypothetical protein J5585_08070, partial [Clostridia bacterium]|nr:hypothetical protein [Clostridia bacterium]
MKNKVIIASILELREGRKTALRQSDSGKDPPKQKYDPFILHNGGILKKREKRRKTKKNGENSPFFKCDPFRTRVMEATSGFGP